MIVYILFFTALILDQLTKMIVRDSMTLVVAGGESIPVLGDFVKLTYIENPGMAFGIQIGSSALLTVFSVIATLGLIAYMIFHWHESKVQKAALALILGGAIGNLIDRILYGSVVDFLDIGIGHTRWPVFNIADAAVVIGMFILIYAVFFAGKNEALTDEDNLSQSA